MKIEQREIVSFLNSIEKEYPVSTWKHSGIDIWPILRLRIWVELSNRALDLNTNESDLAISPISKVKRALFAPLIWVLKSFSDFNKSYFILPKGDLFVLGDGASFIRKNDLFFDRFVDSLDSFLPSGKLKLVRADSGTYYYTPRYSKSFFIQPKIDRVILGAILKSRFFKGNEELQIPKGLQEHLKAYNLEDFVNPNFLKQRVIRMKALSKMFYSILKKGNYKAGLSVCYYTEFGMALNKACRDLKINSFDIQHGVQGDNHGSYAKWIQNPGGEGYSLLPSYFLVWSPHEKEVIRKWGNLSKKHDALDLGNLQFNAWRLERANSQFKSGLEDIINPKLTSVLISLGWDLSDEVTLRTTLEIMKKYQNEYNWLFRLHPSMMNEKEKTRLKEMLASNGIQNYEMDMCSSVSLFDVLAITDIHITHSSSVVLEASWFKIKSIITSEYGWGIFNGQLAADQIFQALTQNELDEALKSIEINRSENKLNKLFDVSDIKDGIDKFLTLVS